MSVLTLKVVCRFSVSKSVHDVGSMYFFRMRSFAISGSCTHQSILICIVHQQNSPIMYCVLCSFVLYSMSQWPAIKLSHLYLNIFCTPIILNHIASSILHRGLSCKRLQLCFRVSNEYVDLHNCSLFSILVLRYIYLCVYILDKINFTYLLKLYLLSCVQSVPNPTLFVMCTFSIHGILGLNKGGVTKWLCTTM